MSASSGFGLNEFAQDAARLHSAARPRLPDRRCAVAAGRVAARAPTRCMRRAVELALETPGVAQRGEHRRLLGRHLHHAPNAGAIFVVLDLFEKRAERSGAVGRRHHRAAVRAGFAAIQEALILVVQPPPVPGIGNAGGFRMMVEDRAGRGPQALQARVYAMMARGGDRTPGLHAGVLALRGPRRRSSISISTAPRRSCSASASPTCSPRCRSISARAYVNDFNLFGRTFRVTAQAEAATARDAERRARASACATEPGPDRAARLVHHRARHLRAISGAALQSLSRGRARRRGGARLFAQGQAIEAMQKLAAETLPDGFALRVDDAGVPADSAPATPRSLPSCWRWCSCSWCWRRSTKA